MLARDAPHHLLRMPGEHPFRHAPCGEDAGGVASGAVEPAGQADGAGLLRLLPRLQVALLLHAAQRHVDGAALRSRPCDDSTSCRPNISSSASMSSRIRTFGRRRAWQLVHAVIIDLTRCKSRGQGKGLGPEAWGLGILPDPADGGHHFSGAETGSSG